MELDLTGKLERSAAAPPVASASSTEESGAELRLELSLGWSYGKVGSMKRVRASDRAVEGKKAKLTEMSYEVNTSYEEGPVPYGLQVMTVILQGPDGYGYPCMVPCWIPSSAEVIENSVDKPGTNRNLVVNMDEVVAAPCQPKVAVGLSSRGSSTSPTSVFQTTTSKGESCSTNESMSHSTSIYVDNPSPISKFSNSQPGLKKPPTHATGEKKPALSRNRRARLSATQMQAVSTRSSEGKKINGYLYQCSKNEVSIICGCHGSYFSPAGFVRHAGGPETQHPLRQITVVSS